MSASASADLERWFYLEAIKREDLPAMPAALDVVLRDWATRRSAVMPHCTDEQRAASHGVGLFLGLLAERGYYVEVDPRRQFGDAS